MNLQIIGNKKTDKDVPSIPLEQKQISRLYALFSEAKKAERAINDGHIPAARSAKKISSDQSVFFNKIYHIALYLIGQEIKVEWECSPDQTCEAIRLLSDFEKVNQLCENNDHELERFRSIKDKLTTTSEEKVPNTYSESAWKSAQKRALYMQEPGPRSSLETAAINCVHAFTQLRNQIKTMGKERDFTSECSNYVALVIHFGSKIKNYQEIELQTLCKNLKQRMATITSSILEALTDSSPEGSDSSDEIPSNFPCE